MRPSLVSSVNFAARNPEDLFRFLREQNTPMFHKSNIFFRDLQYGFWRYLQMDQSKIPYLEVEQATAELVELLKQQGILRQIGRNNFEVNLPKYAAGASAPAAAAPAAKAATPKASAPAAASSDSGATSQATAPKSSGAAMSDSDKAAKIEELKRKMAEARARAQAGQ